MKFTMSVEKIENTFYSQSLLLIIHCIGHLCVSLTSWPTFDASHCWQVDPDHALFQLHHMSLFQPWAPQGLSPGLLNMPVQCRSCKGVNAP